MVSSILNTKNTLNSDRFLGNEQSKITKTEYNKKSREFKIDLNSRLTNKLLFQNYFLRLTAFATF